ICISESCQEFVYAHLIRTKDHVRASVVFPPVSGQYASLGVEPLKEGRARIWNQYIERCILNGHLLQKIKSVLEDRRSVVVKSKNNPRLNGYSMCMDAFDGAGIEFHLVEAFVYFLHA